MVKWVGARWAAALLTTGLSGCANQPIEARTELLLVADTNIAELTRVTFEVSADGRATETRSAAVTEDGAPLTLGLVREQGPLGPLTAVARGFAGDQMLVARTAVVYFEAGRTLVVPLHLLRDCIDVVCGAGESCTERGCKPAAVPSGGLAEWPGLPPDVSIITAPPRDGDAAVDASATDAASDASPGDGGTGDDGGIGTDGAVADAGLDAAIDSDGGLDAGDLDAGLDAGDLDAAADAASDAATDAGDLDAASDAAADAASDAGADAGSDAGLTQCGSSGLVDLQKDTNHCGTCSTVCYPSYVFLYHDVPACSAGTCGYSCAALWGNCNNVWNILDRCETYLGTDTDNCGACGHVCASGQSCSAGVCSP